MIDKKDNKNECLKNCTLYYNVAQSNFLTISSVVLEVMSWFFNANGGFMQYLDSIFFLILFIPLLYNIVKQYLTVQCITVKIPDFRIP